MVAQIVLNLFLIRPKNLPPLVEILIRHRQNARLELGGGREHFLGWERQGPCGACAAACFASLEAYQRGW
jgi:hypothetical protein